MVRRNAPQPSKAEDENDEPRAMFTINDNGVNLIFALNPEPATER